MSRRRGRPWRQPRTLAAGLSEREASHIAFFDLVFAGRTDAAIAALVRTSDGMAARRAGRRQLPRTQTA